jgi:hypothetical protein
METPKIIKALRMCCDAGVEQTPELLCEVADALKKADRHPGEQAADAGRIAEC